MKGETNPKDDGNTTQAPGSGKRNLASKENLPSIWILMHSIRKEKEHETLVQGVLVMRLKLSPGSDASFRFHELVCQSLLFLEDPVKRENDS